MAGDAQFQALKDGLTGPGTEIFPARSFVTVTLLPAFPVVPDIPAYPDQVIEHPGSDPVIFLIDQGPVDGREFLDLDEKDDLSAEGVALSQNASIKI